jgi:hypothetical protein
MRQQLLNRLTGGVLFDADIDADAGTSGAVRLGLAVKAGPYDVWIWDRHVEIGCQIHKIEAWAAFGEADIMRMDGERGVRFWREWRGPLLAVAKADGRPLPAPAEREAA